MFRVFSLVWFVYCGQGEPLSVEERVAAKIGPEHRILQQSKLDRFRVVSKRNEKWE